MYFRCKKSHGLFVHLSKVVIIPPSPADEENAPPAIAASDSKHEAFPAKAPSLADRLQKAAVPPPPVAPNGNGHAKEARQSDNSVPSAGSRLSGNFLPMDTPFKAPAVPSAVMTTTRKQTVGSAVAAKYLSATPKAPVVVHNPSAATDAIAVPGSVIRSAEELRAEIRKLHEEKLGLLDKVDTLTREQQASKARPVELGPQAADPLSVMEQKRLKRLEVQLEEERKKAADVERERMDLIERLSALQAERLATPAKQGSFFDTALLREKDSEISGLEMQLDNLKELLRAQQQSMKEADSMKADFEERQRLVARLEAKESQLSADNALLQRQFEAAKKQLDEARSAAATDASSGHVMTALERKLGERGQEILQLQRRVSDLQFLLDEKDEERKVLDTSKAFAAEEARKRESQLRERLLEKDRELALLSTKCSALQVHLEELRATEKRQSVSSGTTESLEGQRRTSFRLLKRLETSIGQIHDLYGAYEHLKADYQELWDAKHREEAFFTAQLESLRQKVLDESTASASDDRSLSREDSAYRGKMADLEANLRATEDRLKKYSVALEDLTQNYTLTQQAFDAASRQAEDAHHSLTQQRSHWEQTVEELRAALRETETERDSLSTKVAELQQHVREDRSSGGIENRANMSPVAEQRERDAHFSNIAKDKRMLERQLTAAYGAAPLAMSHDTTGYMSSLLKRIANQRAIFSALKATSHLSELDSVERALMSQASHRLQR